MLDRANKEELAERPKELQIFQATKDRRKLISCTVCRLTGTRRECSSIDTRVCYAVVDTHCT